MGARVKKRLPERIQRKPIYLRLQREWIHRAPEGGGGGVKSGKKRRIIKGQVRGEEGRGLEEREDEKVAPLSHPK